MLLLSLAQWGLEEERSFCSTPSPHGHRTRWVRAGSHGDLCAGGLPCASAGGFPATHAGLAALALPVVDFRRAASSSVCDHCRSCFHLGLFPSLLPLYHLPPPPPYLSLLNLWREGLETSGKQLLRAPCFWWV